MLIVLLVFVPLVLFLVRWLQEKNQYWEKRKVKHLPPKLFFGNSYECLTGKKHTSEIIEQAYLKFPDEDVIGYYEYLKPQLIIRKPEIIESVLVKDFSHFMDRNTVRDSSNNPLAINLFNMTGKQWKAFRQKLSPIFTAGRLKSVFGPLAECGQNLSKLMDDSNEKEVDLKEIMNLFTIDVIGSCAFGMDPGVMHNPSSQFRANAKKIFDLDVLQYFRIMTIAVFPRLAENLGISFIRGDILKYFCDILSSTLNFRQKHGIVRNDFMQMLIKLKEEGKIEMQNSDPADEYLKMDGGVDNYEIIISDELLMGTAFGFIPAGFHTTASTLTYALYELSKEPLVLERVRKEIKGQIAVHGGITYDALRCMIYLEKVLKETLRLHPSAGSLLRVCTKAYTLPSGLRLEPGDTVVIPVLALHRDPFLHRDAHTFNPDRFDSPPPPSTYLPFGQGPRICIAMRFAMLEMKFAISKILMNYNIKLSGRTTTPLKMTPRGFLNTPRGEVYFQVSKNVLKI